MKYCLSFHVIAHGQFLAKFSRIISILLLNGIEKIESPHPNLIFIETNDINSLNKIVSNLPNEGIIPYLINVTGLNIDSGIKNLEMYNWVEEQLNPDDFNFPRILRKEKKNLNLHLKD